jgi:hypothetical protein
MGPAYGNRTMTHRTARWFPVVLRIVRSPRLWWTAIRQFIRMIPSDWWRRRPFLPVPDAAYVRFRMETAYGHTGATTPDDVVRYLEWCRRNSRP